MWGMWDAVHKRFIFGIRTEHDWEARAALKGEIGHNAYRKRYVPKQIPDGWKNPKNPNYKVTI